MQDDLKILPQETITGWFKRITMPGKYSTLQGKIKKLALSRFAPAPRPFWSAGFPALLFPIKSSRIEEI